MSLFNSFAHKRKLTLVNSQEFNGSELFVQLGVYHVITTDTVTNTLQYQYTAESQTFQYSDWCTACRHYNGCSRTSFTIDNVMAVINMGIWNNVKGAILDLVFD